VDTVVVVAWPERRRVSVAVTLVVVVAVVRLLRLRRSKL
jgi:hypothetical protein